MTAGKILTRIPSVRVAIVLGIILVIALAFSLFDLSPDLAYVDVRLLSGPEKGNYAVIGKRLSKLAAERQGKVVNEITEGTVANLERLVATARSCDAQFALVQDGVQPPRGSKLHLIARLPKSESLFLLGKNASQLTAFSQLRGMKIGLGPKKGGTDSVTRRVFESDDFRALGLKLSNHGYDEQLGLVESGGLDLGAFIIDEDAALIRNAVRRRKLQIAAFAHLDVIARRHQFLWHGRVGAGQFDPIAVVPSEDRRVLRVDTLVVGNGCASHAETIGLLSLLNKELPRFIEHNRNRGSSSFYPTSASARAFFENQGPQFAEVHVPWLVDIMPPSNWVYIVMAISMLFNVMALGHRFQLWRVDATRVKIEGEIYKLLGEHYTLEEIRILEPEERHLTPEIRAEVARIVKKLSGLRVRCRNASVSMLVPMGQEMGYRYQEFQIEEALVALRAFQARLAGTSEGGAEVDAEPDSSEEP